ncbi:hypothetical protein [Methanoculleus sp.]|jgi:hypothetical protein|uniref:hypothetical protein n=1 Tax=Methanoculleus sp. TaxID=90427 RepID=UPI001BD5E17A|nr:hypothetical protein [Methanoculleus sp.]
MALIERGSFDQFAVSFKPPAFEKAENVKRFATFGSVRQATRVVQAAPLEFETSKTNCGLALKSIKLHEDFGGFLQNFFDPTSNIYFLCWSWDLSGNPVTVYPGEGVPVEQVVIPMKPGKTREFIGVGILLHPARRVTSGLAVRMNIWESDKNVRDVGKTLVDVTETIQNSKLNSLLSLIALSTGVSGVTVELVKQASLELTNVVGNILKANSDDYVDFFEGYYPASLGWPPSEEETSHGHACEVTLKKFI